MGGHRQPPRRGSVDQGHRQGARREPQHGARDAAPRGPAALRAPRRPEQARRAQGLPHRPPRRLPRALREAAARRDPRPRLRGRHQHPQGLHAPLPRAAQGTGGALRDAARPAGAVRLRRARPSRDPRPPDGRAPVRHGARLLALHVRRSDRRRTLRDLPRLPRPRLCLLRRHAARGALRQRQDRRPRALAHGRDLQRGAARLRRTLRLPPPPLPPGAPADQGQGRAHDRLREGRRPHRPVRSSTCPT